MPSFVNSTPLITLAKKRITPQKLAAVQKKWDPSFFVPTCKIDPETGAKHWRKPRISKRLQADMRKNCIYLGIDPLSIGLPEKPDRNPPRTKPPKGNKADRLKPIRQAKIQKAMEDMPKTIEKWKTEKRTEKQKSKPSLPY
ncbi:1028_t:CDS:2 [Ambispora leptoticha]|uniref:1028_t:CDS:1 n=1 Tax=Ambispora leptoticha TaxID=144679 RepID=A0A9N8YXZ0_9GLOM|nr:1028_t:CDS:2 [Ambispora leptoticha]